ncbi:MAG: endo-1,4-beta-xylanase [Clostridiales Family XIII bacterium]|nr:endo-1,4-beta-xylanase [Clostridiales Family XIII bacterium]
MKKKLVKILATALSAMLIAPMFAAPAYAVSTGMEESAGVVSLADVNPEDAAKVAAAKEALTWAALANGNVENDVKTKLNLPLTFADATLSWSCVPEGVITTSVPPGWEMWAPWFLGNVSIPPHGEPDVDVTLVATVSVGTATDTKTFNLTVKAYNPAVPSLWKEYEDYFIMGTFGGWNSSQQLYHYKTNSPSNDLKLDAQIGNSSTASNSRAAYLAAVAAINADAGLTQEQKAAKIEDANRDVILADNPNSISILNAIREWNAAHPEDKKVVRAHVLAWHGGQQPNYFFMNGFTYDTSKTFMENDRASEATMLARLDNYIMKMMERYAPYKDVIYSWDVVNEPIDDYSGQIRNMEGYQSGQWGGIFRHPELDGKPDERLYAESAWVRQAFASARKWSNHYGADWKLYINDFQDSNKPYEPKMSQTVKMLKPIYEAGNIDGYGMQGRLAYAYPTIDMLREQIELGLTVADEISISEGDIRSDFIPNPDYDPTKPSTHVRDRGKDDPALDWPTGSGSWALRSSDGGNTFDTDNSPVKRNPQWNPASVGLSTDPDVMRAQADFAADWMDLLIEYKDKVVAYQWDGTSDSSTFNSNKGAHLWDSQGNEKYSFFAVIGAPGRDKLKKALASSPATRESSRYLKDGWDAYVAARAVAEPLVTKRIYDMAGVDAVKEATADLEAAVAALVEKYVLSVEGNTASLTNNTATAVTANLIFAGYDSAGRLVCSEAVNKRVDAGKKETVEFKLDKAAYKDCTFKVYAWDNRFAPLTSPQAG